MKKLLVIGSIVAAFAIGLFVSGAWLSADGFGRAERVAVPKFVNEDLRMDQRPGMMEMGQGNYRGNGMMGMGQSEYHNGRGMMGGMNGFHMGNGMPVMRDMMGSLINETAQALKITPDELQTELQAGKSIAEISKAKGVKMEELTKRLQNNIRTKLEQWKKEGLVTAEEQDELFNHMSGNLEWMLERNGSFGCGEYGGRGAFVN